MEVANEILRQLGGNKFLAMTGSKELVGGKNMLAMKLTRNAVKAQRLRITLEADDTYTMLFFSINKDLDLVPKAEVKGVYCDMLQGVFTEKTGLYTHL